MFLLFSGWALRLCWVSVEWAPHQIALYRGRGQCAATSRTPENTARLARLTHHASAVRQMQMHISSFTISFLDLYCTWNGEFQYRRFTETCSCLRSSGSVLVFSLCSTDEAVTRTCSSGRSGEQRYPRNAPHTAGGAPGPSRTEDECLFLSLTLAFFIFLYKINERIVCQQV